MFIAKVNHLGWLEDLWEDIGDRVADRQSYVATRFQAVRDRIAALQDRYSFLDDALSSPFSETAATTAATTAIVTTNKDDYAPGETVTITARNFASGSILTFNVQEIIPGSDGLLDVDDTFTVTDGGAGDADGIANGIIETSYIVPFTDENGNGVYDSGEFAPALDSTLLLTATGDAGTVGDTSDDQVATTTFTDSVGDLSATDHEGQKQVVAPGPDGRLGTADDIKSVDTSVGGGDGYTNGNIVEYFAGDPVNYRFDVTTASGITVEPLTGRMAVQYTAKDNTVDGVDYDFFSGEFYLGTHSNHVDPITGDSVVGAPVLEKAEVDASVPDDQYATWTVAKVGDPFRVTSGNNEFWNQDLRFTKSILSIIDGKLDVDRDNDIDADDDGAILGNFDGTIQSVNVVNGALVIDDIGDIVTFFAPGADFTTTNDDITITLYNGLWDTNGDGSAGSGDIAILETGGEGGIRTNYHIYLDDEVGRPSGSSQNSSLANSVETLPTVAEDVNDQYFDRNGGSNGITDNDFGNIGNQTVSIPGKDVLISPDILITKLIDRTFDDSTTFEPADENEYLFSLYLWNDINGNGDGLVQETELEFLTSEQTNKFGQVEFIDVGDGTFVISEQQVDTSQDTYSLLPNDGVEPEGIEIVDSGDPFGRDGDYAVVTTTVGTFSDVQEAEVIFRNFLDFEPIDLSGYKWLDTDGDGDWNGEEAGYNGVTIVLDVDEIYDNGNEIREVDTANDGTNDGAYSFQDITPSEIGDATTLYVYELTPTGFTQTYGNYSVAALSGGLVEGTYGMAEEGNFGNFENIDLSGYKWLDTDGDGDWNGEEAGYNGVTIVLDVDEIYDNGNEIREVDTANDGTNDGAYSFQDITPSEIGDATTLYVYELTPTGFTQTYGNYSVAALSGGLVEGTYGTAEEGNFGNFTQEGQPSIEVTSLTAFDSDGVEGKTTQLSGTFTIRDASEPGNDPDGFIIALDQYQVDFGYTSKGPFKPASNPNAGGRDSGDDTLLGSPDLVVGGFDVDDELTHSSTGYDIGYTIQYRLISIDGDTSVAQDLNPGENLFFDESITLGYTATFTALPDDGSLRGVAEAGIFFRDDKTFLFRESFNLPIDSIT